MVSTQKPADLGHAGIPLMLIECRAVFLGTQAHGAELIDIERTAKAAYALLFEDGRPAILPLHQYVAYSIRPIS